MKRPWYRHYRYIIPMMFVGGAGGHCITIHEYTFAGIFLALLFFALGAYLKDTTAVDN